MYIYVLIRNDRKWTQINIYSEKFFMNKKLKSIG